MGTSVLTDPCFVVGRLAADLAAAVPLPAALEALVLGLGLRTAVVRAASGELLGVGGEVLHAVPVMRTLPSSLLEVPVAGSTGGVVATLTVVGARPSMLPALRAVASVLSLSLAPSPAVEALLEGVEAERDELADALHDGPVQSLVVARYAADAAVRGGDVVSARDAVQQGLVETRRALWHLRPRGADGLLDALRQLSQQQLQVSGLPLELAGDLASAALLRGSRAVLAYRLVQAHQPHAVTFGHDGDLLVVDLSGGRPPADSGRWATRAQALGGDLLAPAGLLRLVLPSPDPRNSSS